MPMRTTHHRRAITLPPQPLASVSNLDETRFFPRVLGSGETYQEFLKLVNLFTQDFIDRARLTREIRSFLEEGEPMVEFKEILGWDEAIERSALAKDREELYQPPGRPLSILDCDRVCREELNIRYESYRRLPADIRIFFCSGWGCQRLAFRISMCRMERAGRDVQERQRCIRRQKSYTIMDSEERASFCLKPCVPLASRLVAVEWENIDVRYCNLLVFLPMFFFRHDELGRGT
ncbi:hypothetical protein EDB85DRAFT_849888 [Lactarius pseudohatsudake]|nr:hypothetical protein EDB85DRAFT_849888 [Lactarius pseudohatsudake]